MTELSILPKNIFRAQPDIKQEKGAKGLEGLTVKPLKPRLISSPYNFKETMGYFIRNYLGVSRKRHDIVAAIPHDCLLNEGVAPLHTIAFVGDIMDMRGNTLQFGPAVKQFISPADYFVGNFEATLTDRNGPIMAQRHIPQILEALAELYPPERTYLSVANNHAGDFGRAIFTQSLDSIHEAGFHVFGTQTNPYCDLGEDVRVIAGSMWSNQKCDYITPFGDIPALTKSNRFNVAYPHWSYELELYPRPVIVEQGRLLLQSCDAVVGHHSHIPQPVTAVEVPQMDGKKFLAYGLGDFCIWEKIQSYFYGIVVKLEIGRDETHQWGVGRVRWEYTKCTSHAKGVWMTEIIEKFPY